VTIEKKTWQYVLTSAAIAVLAVASLIALDTYGKSRRVYHRPGRLSDGVVEKIITKTPGAAFTAWKARGFTGRAVVYATGAWERIDNIYDAPVSRPYPLRLFRLSEVLAPGELTSATILYDAVLNKIARRITVILPKDKLDNVMERARKTKEFLIEGDRLYFPYQGMPRWFTTVKGFKKEQEPALLYVDASYFRSEDPEELYQRLAGAGLETDNVILCREEGNQNITDVVREKLMRFAELINRTAGSGNQ
jgi:hypothetical protein